MNNLRSETMNRLLTCTALGLILGLSPALAQQPGEDAQDPPSLQEQMPSEQQPLEAVPSEPAQPSDPAAPIPGDTSQGPSEPAMSPSAEAPQSIEPAAPKSAEAGSGDVQFLTQQQSDDYLASSLIGKTVYNGQDESIGEINDLVTDSSGKVVAVLIGHGGFLGMGEKDVGIRFEDLKLTRDEDNNIKVIADLDSETIASAPDYVTLSEKSVTVGVDSERDDAQRGASENY
jgi:hypothetical protein